MKGIVKILPFLLIFIFGLSIFNHSIFHFISLSQKKDFRKELFSKSAASLELKIIHRNMLYKNTGELEWKDGNKELCIKGEYFEVIKIQEEAGSNFIKVYLIKDCQENLFFANYFNAKKKNNDLLLSLVKLFFGMQLPMNCSPSIPATFPTVEKYYVSSLPVFFNDYYRKIIKPPIS